MKRNTLRWFGHTERMGSEEFLKKVYVSESVHPNSRGRSIGRWRNRVKEYMCESSVTEGEGWIKQQGSVWAGKGGNFSAMATTLGMFVEGVRHQSYRYCR